MEKCSKKKFETFITNSELFEKKGSELLKKFAL